VKLDAVATATDRVFNLFYVFGAVGTVLSAVFIVFCALRERQARSDYLAAQEQHSNDYKGERRFYEERALAYERRERASQDYILTLARKTSGREFRLLDQQISQGQVSTIRSSEILTEQLRSLSQLGDVIKLVKETFHLELTKSKEDIEERRKRQETEHMVGAFRGFYKARYTRVNELISSFGRHTAMDWTALTDEEIALALRARIIFEGIPEFVLEDERTSDSWAFARTCQLLGVSAFYANDIESAIELLNRSRDIYSKP